MIIVINDSGSQDGCALLKEQKQAHQINFSQEKKRKDKKLMVTTTMMIYGNLSVAVFAVNAIFGL